MKVVLNPHERAILEGKLAANMESGREANAGMESNDMKALALAIALYQTYKESGTAFELEGPTN